MKALLNCLLASLLLVNLLPACLAQEIVESNNWIGTIEGGVPPYLLHVYKRYNEADVESARKKLESLQKQPETNDGWSGTYNLYGELSDSKLRWDSGIGFVSYYIFTCATELRSLNYGRISEDSDSVTFISDKTAPPYAFMDSGNSQKLIKVKWGDRRFLVKESELQTFAELAAGYYGSSVSKEITSNGETFPIDVSIWNSTWSKVTEDDKNVFGIPEFPARYRHLIKKPIAGKIVAIGRYEKDPQTDDPVMTYSRRYVTLNVGSKDGVRPEMEFYVAGTRERVQIVSVLARSSVAVLERWIDSDTQKDMCFEKGEDIPCKSPRIGMIAKTIPDAFLDD
jgi:hypothetical protein